MFSTSSIKTWKKLKNTVFKRPQYWFLSSRKLWNHFLRRFIWPSFNLKNFKHFALLFQNIVSISSLKNCKKLENLTSQMLRPFVFYLKVASKPFSKKLSMTNFSVSQKTVSTLSLKTLQKNWEMSFSKSKPFSKKLHIKFWLKQFLALRSLSQEAVWTLSIENFRRTRKCHFQSICFWTHYEMILFVNYTITFVNIC